MENWKQNIWIGIFIGWFTAFIFLLLFWDVFLRTQTL